MNSIEATTKVEDLASQKNKLLSQAAKTISEYISEIVFTSGTGDGITNQVLNMCKGFSTEDSVKILAMTLEYIAKRNGGKARSSQKKSSKGSFKGSDSSYSDRDRSFLGGGSYGGWGR